MVDASVIDAASTTIVCARFARTTAVAAYGRAHVVHRGAGQY